MDGLCSGCFNSHFPQPNMKICKLKQQVHSSWPRRMRGGAGSSTSNLVTQAIESASKHGMNLEEGKLNKADGNCAFEAIINNINERKCFQEKLSLPSNVYRQIWITKFESESAKYPSLGAGFTKEEQDENWNQLKHSGVYEVEFFGDFVIHAIAKGCKKNILIFNTSTEAADPIYVIQAKEFGGFSDTDIPIVVGYNQVHYESLHPVTETDVEKTKELVNSYISGTYGFKKNDIQFLTSSASEEKSSNKPFESKSTSFRIPNSYEEEFPLLKQNIPESKRREQKPKIQKTPKPPPQKKHKSCIEPLEDEDRLSDLSEQDDTIRNDYSKKLEELKKIKNKDRTEAEKCIYRDLVNLLRTEKQKESMQKLRAKKTSAEMLESNVKAKERMNSLRSRKTSEEKQKDESARKKSLAEKTEEEREKTKMSNKEAQQKLRGKKTEEEKQKEKESKKKSIAKKTEEEREKTKMSNKESHQNARRYPKCTYAARNAQNILLGNQIVKEMNDTDNGIRRMNRIFDSAWQKNGKMKVTQPAAITAKSF